MHVERLARLLRPTREPARYSGSSLVFPRYPSEVEARPGACDPPSPVHLAKVVTQRVASTSGCPIDGCASRVRRRFDRPKIRVGQLFVGDREIVPDGGMILA